MSRKTTKGRPSTEIEAELRMPASKTGRCLSGGVDDERYPGSFFRVPGVPMPAKTVWSLSR